MYKQKKINNMSVVVGLFFSFNLGFVLVRSVSGYVSSLLIHLGLLSWCIYKIKQESKLISPKKERKKKKRKNTS